MANERQFKLRTRFVATRGVKEYRESINEWVTPRDSVLEIGCEWGTTTALIAQRCKDVIGTDISEKVIERARAQHPDLRFAAFDAFDVLAASRLGDFSKVYIDMSGLSGYRSLLDVISLLTMYATVLRPDAIVVKSGALKHFASHCVAWQSQPFGDGDADDEDND
jgi:2-polyprenyl-3-methyl-5-hydroxy-6-metoxy-1,4-benzoquinol methylase